MAEGRATGSLHIDRDRIRTAHEGRLASWPADPRPLTIRAEVAVIESHRKTSRVGTFTIESDEGAIVGGEGTAPTPLSYFTSAIGLAVLTDLVRAFAVFELPVDDLRLAIEAEFPLDAKYGSGVGSVAADAVRYTVDIAGAGGASRERVLEAIAWAEHACHAVASLREPVPVEATYRLDGETVALPDPHPA